MKKWLCFTAILLIFSCSKDPVYKTPDRSTVDSSSDYPIPEQIDDGLETGRIEDAGIDPDKLYALIENNGEYLHSLLVLRYGKLVFEEYFKGGHMKMTSPITWQTQTVQFDRDTQHYQASVTKSIMSALIGICINQGLIENIQVTLSSYYPEYASIFESDERKKKITLEHVLNMKAGFVWDGATTSTEMINGRESWAKYVLNQPMENEPGRVFNYNDGLSVLLGDIVTRVSGKSSRLFAQENLFNKIRIDNPFWDVSRWGEVGGGWGLWLTPRDMVKFGKLFLNDGKYDGEFVISSAWVKKSKTRTSKDGALYYCYHWWSREYTKGDRYHSALIAAGAGGQYIIIVPSLDLVVVFTGGDYDYEGTSPLDLMQRYIVPACTESS